MTLRTTYRMTACAAGLMLLLAPAGATAQQAATIAGGVTDTTGGVLPGVTVEIASPALIEQFRTAVTDAAGRYAVVELRPGTYSVTFELPGFSRVVREGIELTSGFTATVDAELGVGTLEETITVSGQSPVVDVQNVRQQTLVSDELMSNLPTSSQALVTLVALIPGYVGAGDVGGGSGIYTSNATYRNMYHGKGNVKFAYDGMRTNNLGAQGATSYVMNTHTAEETSVQTGGVSAESAASGASINLIPKEGSNALSVDISGTFTHETLQSNNLNNDLRARGLQHTNTAPYLYDSHVGIGGAIVRDRLWFYTAGRLTGSKIGVPGIFVNDFNLDGQPEPHYADWQDLGGLNPFYKPGEPAHRTEFLKSLAGRFTWQATEKNKINVFADTQSFVVRGRGTNATPEAGVGYNFWPQGLYQVTWTMPATNRLLFEAGASLTKGPWHYPSPGDGFMEAEGGAAAVAIQELTTGLWYNAKSGYNDHQRGDRWVQRASVSYVTGSHNIKGGIYMEEGFNHILTVIHQDQRWATRNWIPQRITQFTTPYRQKNWFAPDLGLYLQDQWVMRRLTLNLGVRYDYFLGKVPEQSVPAGQFRFTGATTYDPVNDVPAWKDINPRLGASYDLSGDGRTALKTSFGRYVEVSGTGLPSRNNPIVTTVNSASRTWTDGNSDFRPDCDLTLAGANGECGALSNPNLGQRRVTTEYDDAVLRGFGARNALWDFSLEIEHELTDGVSFSAGYFRNWATNFRVTDNRAVDPSNFSEFCITAPPAIPARRGDAAAAVIQALPGAGQRMCGFWDVNPSHFGRFDNFVTHSQDFHGEGTGIAFDPASGIDPAAVLDDFVTCEVNGTLARSGGAFSSMFGNTCGVSDFFNFTIDVRTSNLQVGGGIDTGRSVFDSCFIVDSPQQLLYCEAERPFGAQMQVKMHWSYTLPIYDVIFSGAYQNTPGPSIEANYSVRNAGISWDTPTGIGNQRTDLAACRDRTGAACTSSVRVPLVAPMTLFEERRNQFDIRISKVFVLGDSARLRANFDVYNLFNSSAILGINQNYGSLWQLPQSAGTALEAILQGRMIQFGGEFLF